MRGTTRHGDLQIHGRGGRAESPAAYSAASTAAPTAASTAASTAAARARPITSLFQRKEIFSTPVAAAVAAAAAGTAKGANVAATALAQQTAPLQVCCIGYR